MLLDVSIGLRIPELIAGEGGIVVDSLRDDLDASCALIHRKCAIA